MGNNNLLHFANTADITATSVYSDASTQNNLINIFTDSIASALNSNSMQTNCVCVVFVILYLLF